MPIAAAALALSAFTGLSAPTYPAVVKGDGALGYYRFNDSTARTRINVNSGSLGAAGNATNDAMFFKGGELPTGIVRSIPGAVVGDSDRAAFYDFTTRTEIPFNSAFNTPNTQPFTVEAWFYPASDQTGTGQAPIANRYTAGANRQGWVFFQRRPDAGYTPGDSGLGWNFRMYNGVGGATPLDGSDKCETAVPYKVGQWQHVVAVYDPVSAYKASVILYVNGLPVKTNSYDDPTLTTPAYQPCTGDHDPSEATSGQPNLSIGCYNNANTGLNPYFGGVDEFAYYGAKLTDAQIFSHYQNATNAARSQSYDSLIKSHNPTVYLRLNEVAPSPDNAVNMGDVRSAGLATHTAEVRHPAASALKSRADDGAAAYHNRNGKSTTTMPFIAENNPDAGVPFTFEAWIRPMRDQQGGQAVVNNRYVSSGHRTGWVIFQRNPNHSYPASEGNGYNFRMYDGVTGSGQDILTDNPDILTNYVVGEWSHLVVTWSPVTDNGDPGGFGNHQFQGILTGYFNGVPVVTNASALYAANTNPTENATPAADLAVGSYNAASTLGNNAFEGDVDELAIYNNYILTPDQVLEHYKAGTNAHPATNYDSLVFTAGFTGPERAGLPKTYLRFNEPAYYPAANSGSLGYLADGDLNLTTNVGVGPVTTGFENPNPSLPLDGVSQWASFNNPSGLNISGQITLEAWIKPAATQGAIARIVTHGPPTPSNFDPTLIDVAGSIASTNEVYLRIEGGTTYAVGSSDGFTPHGASAAIPGGDLGSASWIHLAGTYDGTNWRLFRNGTQIAISASAVGALPVIGADWAVGSTGNGWGDNFAGGIDEVAIYGTALTPTTIAAHYYVGQNGPVSLTIAHGVGNAVVVTWPAGTLQESSTAGSGYTDVLSGGLPVTSPYNPPVGPLKFYRVKL